MATEMVFRREIEHGEDEFAQACLDAYEELKQHTGPDYDEISPVEYFATRTDGSAEWRSYGHKGMSTYVAVIVERGRP